MLKSFLNELKQLENASTSKFLLAVSGGVDSVVLFELFYQLGLKFEVAHCNFNLRDAESDQDELFIKDLARVKGVKLHVKSFDTKSITEGSGQSTQMIARKLRYEWFQDVAKETGLDYVVTAHHSDDNIETVLLNIARGSSYRGLTGMKFQNGNLIRPLLCFTKEEIRGFAIANEMSWREDSSNDSLKYKRNRVRHELIPLFEKLNPGFKNTLRQNISRWSLTSEFMQNELDGFKAKVAINEGYRVQKAKFPKVLLADLLAELQFSFDQITSILDADHSGKSWVSKDFEALYDRGDIVITKTQVREEFRVLNIDGVGEYEVLNSTLNIQKQKVPVEFKLPDNEACFAIEKLEFPLSIRKWELGDKFQPLGMKGKKKLSDFMIDKKIPLNLKDNVLVLCDNRGSVVWVIGHRMDDKYKITTNTKEVYKATLS